MKWCENKINFPQNVFLEITTRDYMYNLKVDIM